MAPHKVTLTIRVADLDQMRLLIWQLAELRSRMVVAADPFASDLDQILDRWANRAEDEHEPE